MGIITNQNIHRGGLILVLAALIVVAGFQPGLSDSQAIEQLRQEAEQGDAEAQYSLGLRYATGSGVPEDDQEAAKWYRKAANQGLAKAQLSLGMQYATGEGVQEDDWEAVKWYRRAADQGYAEAQFYLGLKYATGAGVPEDDLKAVKWFRKAADQGNVVAQFHLGMQYATGEGVLQDFVKAYAWLNVVSAQGIPKAGRRRDQLSEKMTPEQLAEGQKLSANCSTASNPHNRSNSLALPIKSSYVNSRTRELPLRSRFLHLGQGRDLVCIEDVQYLAGDANPGTTQRLYWLTVFSRIDQGVVGRKSLSTMMAPRPVIQILSRPGSGPHISAHFLERLHQFFCVRLSCFGVSAGD